MMAAGLLAACSGGDSGKPELIWYINPDPTPPADQTGPYGQPGLAEKCSTDQYTITTQTLPTDASQQRIQLARRLAAGDTAIDLMSLDPPFTAEFANAGYLAEIPSDLQSKLESQSLDGIKEAATWDGQLVVAPLWANTQVLWYRKSFTEKAGLDMSQPVTWDQIITAASDNNGTVGVQANKYEGYSVWINALISGAGGTIVEDPEAGDQATITIDSPAGEDAAKVIEELSSSSAAEPDLSVSNEGTVLEPFASDQGAFQVNWTFVWGNYQGDEAVANDLGWTMYPRTVKDEPAAPPLGGIGIGVNAKSNHVDEAMKAVECITSPENQGVYAFQTGNMPATAQGYENKDLLDAYPADLLALFRESVNAAAPRTVTPYWSDISSSLQSTWHPPNSVNNSTPQNSATFLQDVFAGRTLL